MKKILIYNRGEIALRAVLAAKMCKLHSIVILETGDFSTLIQKHCDETIISTHNSIYTDLFFLDEYLTNNPVDYLYPGYGYLSEDPKLEKICLKHNVSFIGPNQHCLTLLSDKKMSGELFSSWGIKTLTIPAPIPKDYPLMLKAAMGGGGRGNLVINSPEEYKDSLSKLKKKSIQLFQNDTILCERFLPNARHVEIQVFATKNKVSIIGSRDCSLQVNYQKVMEEGPVNLEIEKKLKKYYPIIEKGLKELGYIGLGTIEFLWDSINQEFYFLEMNTRIQVEHTVTEELLSASQKVNLVEKQIKIFHDDDNKEGILSPEVGHAINLRLYAIDTENNFRPCDGLIHHVEISDEVRFDHSITLGERVSPQFDPLLGKLVVTGSSRQECIKNAVTHLKSIIIHGVKTNSAYLLSILNDDTYLGNNHDISYLEKGFNTDKKQFALDSQLLTNIRLQFSSKNKSEKVNYLSYSITLAPDGKLWIQDNTNLHIFIENFYPSLSRGEKRKTDHQHIASPVTGVIREVKKASFDIVKKGDAIFTVESMKMFFDVEAPKDGTLQEFKLQVGSSVNADEILIRID